jgi:hypothetical protein
MFLGKQIHIKIFPQVINFGTYSRIELQLQLNVRYLSYRALEKYQFF